MSLKQTKEFFTSFDEVFIRLSNKIETAKNRNEHLAWKNHRQWYMKLVRETKNKFKKLKTSVRNFPELKKSLENLNSSLTNIYNVNSETTQKAKDLEDCRQILQRFQKELENKIKEGFDLFPQRNFDEDSKLCFVLMPFDNKFTQVYVNGIKPAIRKAKLISRRADGIFDVKPIVKDIWENINKSTLIIADLTDRNPNVFYEVGLSHAIPKRLIILTQKKEDVPFDLQYIRWIPYTNDVRGRKALSNKLYQTIKTVLS